MVDNKVVIRESFDLVNLQESEFAFPRNLEFQIVLHGVPKTVAL